MSDQPTECQATPSEELRRQIMSWSEPKNEREWWALRHIEEIEAALAERERKIARLRDALEFADHVMVDFLMASADPQCETTEGANRMLAALICGEDARKKIKAALSPTGESASQGTGETG